MATEHYHAAWDRTANLLRYAAGLGLRAISAAEAAERVAGTIARIDLARIYVFGPHSLLIGVDTTGQLDKLALDFNG